jgi:hypothetical protein
MGLAGREWGKEFAKHSGYAPRIPGGLVPRSVSRRNRRVAEAAHLRYPSPGERRIRSVTHEDTTGNHRAAFHASPFPARHRQHAASKCRGSPGNGSLTAKSTEEVKAERFSPFTETRPSKW